MSTEQEEEKITRENSPMFFKMWDIMCVEKWKKENKHNKGFKRRSLWTMPFPRTI